MHPLESVIRCRSPGIGRLLANLKVSSSARIGPENWLQITTAYAARTVFPLAVVCGAMYVPIGVRP
jgi:hypothetical protein